jgi:hypothetical protein
MIAHFASHFNLQSFNSVKMVAIGASETSVTI